MKKIRELFERPIDRPIEEVIKVDQHDEETVLQEIQEYVLTDSIKEHFYTLYDRIAQYPHEPHEGIGVWVSGFFGSGKSSFAKILGYTLSNRTVVGKPASEWFIEIARDGQISNYLKNILSRFKIHAVIFDVSMDRGVRTASDRITEVMYKVLLRELGYPEDFDLAELEITLEADGELDRFRKLYEERYGKSWDKGKKSIVNALVEASNILHQMYPEKYTSPESFLHAIGQRGRADIDANKLARLAFELVVRRKPDHGIIYIIDEVGQYVARSTDKMLDLQAVVQALGRESKNRVKAGKAMVPAWLIVTSQEKLDEVVDALDQKRIELARLQDRFPIAIDLKQSDIQEVTAKRILLKKKTATEILGSLYDKYEGRLKTHCSLERTHRKTSFTKEEFINLYPYLPYQIDLSIEIVSGLRSKRGAQLHVGGSNRTIIKQAQQMLIHPRTNLADQSIGALVTLDKIFDLLSQGSLLPTEMTREIDEIPKRFPGDEMALKVAKAVALLEVVRDLPRTVHNIAVVLYPSVDADSLEADVQAALKRLEEAQFVRETEQGYKLLTVQEKNWETERQSKSPKQREKDELLNEFFKAIFSEPNLRIYRFKNLATFRLGITLNNQKIEDGSPFIHFYSADNETDFNGLKEASRKRSREEEDEIFWIFTLTEDIHQLIIEYFRSRSMIQEYSRLQSQQQITREEIACLEDERQRENRLQQNLKSALIKAIEAGTAIFRGLEKQANLLGNRLSEQIKNVLDTWLPEIYPKLEMGARRMTGKEAEDVLTTANLQTLSPIFYDGPDGLHLITRQGEKMLPNMKAPVVQEVFSYLKRENEYGNRVTGKSLENHFSGPPYGWDRDLLRLVLAVIFRANQLEVNYQGQKYKSFQDPNARTPFINQIIFRSATFAPRQVVGLKTLTQAAKHFEEITGQEIDVEESAIASAFKELARKDQEILKNLFPTISGLGLPGEEHLRDFGEELNSILQAASDDCVKTLAGEGNTCKTNRDFLFKVKSALTKENIETLSNAKKILDHIWPRMEERGSDGELAERQKELQTLFLDQSLYDQIEAVRINAEAIFNAYEKIYSQMHHQRNEVVVKAIERIKGHPDFPSLSTGEQENILIQFKRRKCKKLLLDWSGNCQLCRASLQQLESDIYSVESLLEAALKRIHDLTHDTEKFVSIPVSEYLRGEYKNIDEIKDAIEELINRIEKAFRDGKTVFLE